MMILMRMLKMALLSLLLLQALLTGVCSQKPREIYVKAGEMVALKCPHSKGYSHSDDKLRWTSYTPEETDLMDGMLDMLVQGRSLVILKALVNHQGNYSCSLGNASRVMWFRLNVDTTNSREYEERTTYSRKCVAQESCILKCPEVNAPVENTLNITNGNISWHKKEESLPTVYYFPSVEEKDRGVYTCTRSYLYQGQIYNMTMRVLLDVHPKKIKKTAAIISPKMNNVFHIDLGATVVIPCEAVLSSNFDEVYWLSSEPNRTFIKTNSSLPVYYNFSRESSAEGKKMTASLVFQKVSEEDLSKQYTCKLSTFQESSSVTVFLKQKILGVCPRKVLVKAGEMVEVMCTGTCRDQIAWTSRTINGMDLASNMSSAELMQMSVVVNGRRLVILNASENHQGNYSCCPGNPCVTLVVFTTWTSKYENWTTEKKTCYRGESCKWEWPEMTLPGAVIYKHFGDSNFYFPSVEEKDRGVYTCTRSYLYQGQIYNMTMRMLLDVRPKKIKKTAAIISPKMNNVFHVDLGATVVIPCEAVLSSNLDEVYWLSGEPNRTFIKTNSSLPVYYNFSRESSAEGKKMTASLVFQKVSEEDLSKQYTCKLSTFQESSSVTVFLKQKILASRLAFSLALCIVIIMIVLIVIVVVYVKLKLGVAPFLREMFASYSSSADRKNNDAFLMHYKSDAGLNKDDMDELRSVLEMRFGCRLRLCDPNISSKKDPAAALLNEMEQSRAVVLVPSASDPCSGSGLLNDIYTDLVQWQTRLVFIKPEATEVSKSDLLPEALQILEKAGECVTWKGEDSLLPNSHFLKQLHCHLPAPQHPLKNQLLPVADTQDNIY